MKVSITRVGSSYVEVVRDDAFALYALAAIAEICLVDNTVRIYRMDGGDYPPCVRESEGCRDRV